MSSQFTVSARKYRPGTFDAVIGQDHITHTLKKAIASAHLGQSLLFCGPRGVGKTTCARILAKALNCGNLSASGEPCGTCEPCQVFQNGQSFNIYELDAASNNSVDDIRSLTEQVRYAPQSGKYKIYIIDEVHMLSASAFNAFLKTLEEPPSYAVFILATTEKHKIIPTILSRCQVFDFHRIGLKSAIQQLKEICKSEGIEAEEEALFVIAQKADGAMRDALSIFDRVVSFSGNKITYRDVIENLNVLDHEYYFSAVDLCLGQDLPGSLLLFDEIISKGFDSHNFLVGLSEHLRNLLVCKDAKTVSLLELSEGTQSRYLAQAKNTDLSFLLSALNILNQFDVNFKQSKNARLHVELALMKLCYLGDALQLDRIPVTGSNGSAAQAEKKKPQPTPELIVEEKIEEVLAPAVIESVDESPIFIDETPAKPVFHETKPSYSVSPAAVEAIHATGNAMALNIASIRAQVKKKKLEAIDLEAPAKSEETVFDRVNEERFTEAWNGYALNLKERGKHSMASMVTKRQPAFTEEGGVIIKVDNVSLKTQFQEDKLAFTDLLNSTYNISNIRIDFEVEAPTEAEMKRYLVSDTDKFRRLAELNPAVLDMQRRLGLVVE